MNHLIKEAMMSQIEQFVPAVIGGTLAWFVLIGLKELFKETFNAFGKKSPA